MRIVCRIFSAVAALLLGISVIVLGGCASVSGQAQTEHVAPSTEAVTEAAPPEALVFGGVSYPLDTTSLTVGPYGLEQLQWATALTELEYIGSAPENWDFLAWVPTLSRLTISLSAGASIDLRLNGSALPALTTLELDTACPIGTLSLPRATLTDCVLRLSAAAQVDTTAAELGSLFLSCPDGPQSLTLGPVTALTFDGFAPPSDALTQAAGLRELTLTTAQPLDFLTALPSLEKLSLYGDGWDLAALPETTVSSLVVPSCDAETLAALEGMASLRSLQLSDACVTELSVLSALPDLETLAILVEEVQPGGLPLAVPLTADDAEALDLLQTTLPTEQLSAFLERGGTLLLLPDYNR